MRASRLLLLLPLAVFSDAQAADRRLPVVDEMPPAPERATESRPAGDFVSFFPRATTVLDKGPDLSRYVIERSAPIEGGYFTLALRDDGREALFVLDKKPVKNLAKSLSSGDPKHGTLDWGFLYDRNGDGWADYIAFLVGAVPVGTPEILARLPKRPMPADSVQGSGSHTMSLDEYKLQLANVRLVFTNYVDDDFDGKTDAIVSFLYDPDHWGWIYRRAVLRSKNHSQIIDEDWVFVQDIAIREGPIPRDADGHFVQLVGLGSVGEKHLEAFTKMFDNVNTGLRGCRIPRGALPR